MNEVKLMLSLSINLQWLPAIETTDFIILQPEINAAAYFKSLIYLD